MPLPTRIVVADRPCNRQHAYWRDMVGCAGILVEKGPDGLWTVQLAGQPVPHEGVNPDRFATTPWSWWVRAKYRLLTALAALRFWRRA